MNAAVKVLLFLAGFITGAITGICIDGTLRDRDRKEAIAAGVARWEINPVTGEKKFTYVKPTE